MKNIKILKGCFGQLGESTEREVSSQDWYFVMLFSFEEAVEPRAGVGGAHRYGAVGSTSDGAQRCRTASSFLCPHWLAPSELRRAFLAIDTVSPLRVSAVPLRPYLFSSLLSFAFLISVLLSKPKP